MISFQVHFQGLLQTNRSVLQAHAVQPWWLWGRHLGSKWPCPFISVCQLHSHIPSQHYYATFWIEGTWGIFVCLKIQFPRILSKDRNKSSGKSFRLWVKLLPLGRNYTPWFREIWTSSSTPRHYGGQGSECTKVTAAWKLGLERACMALHQHCSFHTFINWATHVAGELILRF